MSEQRVGGKEEEEVQTGISDGYNYTQRQRGALVPPLLHDLRGSILRTYPHLTSFISVSKPLFLGSRGHH